MTRVQTGTRQSPSFDDVVRLILREGYTLHLRDNGDIEVKSWHSYPEPEEHFELFERFFNQLKRRLKPPRGWPKDVPLPDWWSDVALGFNILRAKRMDCPECGFPVAVLVDFQDWAELRCPQCGISLEIPTGRR